MYRDVVTEICRLSQKRYQALRLGHLSLLMYTNNNLNYKKIHSTELAWLSYSTLNIIFSQLFGVISLSFAPNPHQNNFITCVLFFNHRRFPRSEVRFSRKKLREYESMFYMKWPINSLRYSPLFLFRATCRWSYLRRAHTKFIFHKLNVKYKPYNKIAQIEMSTIFDYGDDIFALFHTII